MLEELASHPAIPSATLGCRGEEEKELCPRAGELEFPPWLIVFIQIQTVPGRKKNLSVGSVCSFAADPLGGLFPHSVPQFPYKWGVKLLILCSH